MVGGMLQRMQSFKFHHQCVQYAHKPTEQIVDSAGVPGMVGVMLRHMQSLMVTKTVLHNARHFRSIYNQCLQYGHIPATQTVKDRECRSFWNGTEMLCHMQSYNSINNTCRSVYAHKPIRQIVLEYVFDHIGVPGMVGGMLRHMQSLRAMRRDNGWIHTLLEEAENERMHLLTFLSLRQPGVLFRGAVLVAQVLHCCCGMLC